MKYEKEKFEIERLENHKEFFKTIMSIRNGEFILSSANTMNHITSLQDKIEVFIKTEKAIKGSGWTQRVSDAEQADARLFKIFDDLIDSGAKW